VAARLSHHEWPASSGRLVLARRQCGNAMAQAYGAASGFSERQVISLSGDGGIQPC